MPLRSSWPRRALPVLALPLIASFAVPGPRTSGRAGPVPAPGGNLPVRAADAEDGDPPLARIVRPAREVQIAPPALARERKGSASAARGTNARPAPLEMLYDGFLFTGSLPEGDMPAGLAFTPDGTRIVVAHRDSQNLIVFDAATRLVVQAIELSGSPQGVAVSADGLHAVTANFFEDTASIVDLTSGQETAVVPIGDQPGVVRITPDSTKAVVGNTKESTLSVLDIASAAEIRRIPNAGFAVIVSMAFEPGVITANFNAFAIADDSTIVHPDYYANCLRIYDIPTGSATTLPSESGPWDVAVTPDGTLAVVAHIPAVPRISVVDVPGRAITKTISIGADCWGPICVRPDGTKAAVAVLNACRVVDLGTDAVSGSLNTASVNELHATADGSYALCVGYYGTLIDFATATTLVDLNGVVLCPLGGVSPAGPRGAMVANSFGEDLVVVNTNGAAGYTEGIVPSGPPPEADKTRTVAISPDGRTLVAANILSDNVSIVDVATGVVVAAVPVGERPAEVAITPDGDQAVVANLDSYFASILDLQTHAVTDVAIGRRASQVEISPDGHYAYLCVVADGDGVWRIDLDTLSVAGAKIPTANMGGIYFLFSQTSGMTLSHDGTTLVVCGSYSNVISLIDTTTWSLVKGVAVGSFPVRAIFSADDARIYVTCKDDDTVREVSNAGAGSTVLRTIAVGDTPFEMALSPDGAKLYVLANVDETVDVVDLATGLVTKSIALPSPPQALHLDERGRVLTVAGGTCIITVGPGPMYSVSMDGDVAVIDARTETLAYVLATGQPPAMLAFDPAGRLGAIPVPFADGLLTIRPGLLYPQGR
ncbi:MAG: YncE family protein [Planctomycetota bacterium]